jgi:hypothetical protein
MAIKPGFNQESSTIKRISRQGKEHRWFAFLEKADAVFNSPSCRAQRNYAHYFGLRAKPALSSPWWSA